MTALMLQGCSSDAGKSVLVAALCRCLLQDGIRVAPFKAQNMSNNAMVDGNGHELGRAQAIQAQACSLAPDVAMNPVLLKPSSDHCQIIMNGTVYGQQQAKDWGSFRDAGLAAACAGFDRLQQQYDVVICEGAGSPGEINLKATDIVNMGFVRERDMPVLLVGDIDRGGIYANFIGHYTVFDEWEKQRLRGYIVNRFRGDASLLSSAHEYVYEHTHKAVVGVVPFIANIGIPDEDRIVLSRSNQAPSRNDLDIAIIHLRHLANFSDIEPFTIEPGVQLRLVHEAAELGHPDAIIIPGSKSTIADCEALHANGLAQAMVALRGQCEIVGICGGYQMLGSQIQDRTGVESQQQQCQGLDLLPMTTTFAANKHTGRSQALHRSSGLTITGFEIHHGDTAPTDALDPMVQVDNRSIGYGDTEQRVWGCYLHGCFDQDEFRRWWLNRLRRQRGLNSSSSGGQWDLEPALDRIAKVFRDNVDLNFIYALLGV